MPEVELRVVDEELLEPLLAAAVAQAQPRQVMRGADGATEWEPEHLDAFREFHRRHYGGLDDPHRTVMFAVLTGGEVAGMIRMTQTEEPGTIQVGMWLGRKARGRGVGTAALRAILARAAQAGAHTVIADTTAGNAAALGMLGHVGAEITGEPGSDRRDARIPVARP